VSLASMHKDLPPLPRKSYYGRPVPTVPERTSGAAGGSSRLVRWPLGPCVREARLT
jgi:hypothetical protein